MAVCSHQNLLPLYRSQQVNLISRSRQPEIESGRDVVAGIFEHRHEP